MSQKLIEFLINFSDFSYNIIAYFYAKICAIYQIYSLHKFKTEMKIPAKIRSENRSRAQMRSRQRMQVTTRSDGKPNKSFATEEHLLRPRQEGLSKKIIPQHRFKVATRKEDIVGRNEEIML